VRPVDVVTERALEGSRPADSLLVWAWRGGRLVLDEPLDVVDWSFGDSAGGSVKIGQQVSLTVADPRGELGAWRFDDALGVGGTELQIIYRVGGAGAINYGKFRITGNEPVEVVDWREIDEFGLDVPDSQLGPHRRKKAIVTAAVKLTAVDLTINPDRDKLEAPESPALAATYLTEVQRLLVNHFPVVVEAGVTDAAIPRTTVYDRERLEAVQDILARRNARYRMGGDGELRVYPRVTDPVWRVEPEKGMVSVSRKQVLDKLYNRWVVSGKDSGDGKPVTAVVSIDTGPLRFGGDHGRAQEFYTSDMIETYGQALAYGIQLRDEFLSSIAVEFEVETTPRPELQGGDWIDVGYPLTAGHVAYFPCQIVGISRSGAKVPAGTRITVQCSYNDMITALGRTEWAQYLTAGTPELIWDRMPSTWGRLPALTWDELSG